MHWLFRRRYCKKLEISKHFLKEILRKEQSLKMCFVTRFTSHWIAANKSNRKNFKEIKNKILCITLKGRPVDINRLKSVKITCTE